MTVTNSGKKSVIVATTRISAQSQQKDISAKSAFFCYMF